MKLLNQRRNVWLPTYQMSGGTEIALRDWEIASLSQSVELRQAASSQIVHLNIK